jgi:hypothetical protein
VSFWDTLKEALKSTFKPAQIAASILPGVGPAAAPTVVGTAKQTGKIIGSTEKGQRLVDRTLEGAQAIATPYRELVAEPFVAAEFEGWAAGGREFLEGLPGQSRFKESEIAQYVSPGQAIVRGIGQFSPWEEAVDKVDFKDRKQVENFFSSGAAKFWSGTADFAFTLGLDPFLVAGKGVTATRTALAIQPIKSAKDLSTQVGKIDDAVVNQPSTWRPIIDNIMSDKMETEADILASGLFAYATKPVDLAASLIAAKKLGREAVGDVLKVAIGDVNALAKVRAQSEVARKALIDAEKVPSWVKAEMEKPIINDPDLVGTFITPSEANKILREADETIKKYAQIDEGLSRILKGDFEAGTEFDGLFGTIRNKTTSRFEFLERARVKNAGRASESYWTINDYTTPDGYTAKILSWLNRGNLQNEVPAGFIITNESASQSAFREVAANTRLLAKKTGQSSAWAKEKVSAWSKLTTKIERNQFIKDFEDEAAYLIIKKRVPGTEDMTDAQLDMLKVLVKEITKGYKQARYKELIKTLDNGYHTLDGSGTPIYVEGLEDLLKALGEDTATYRAKLVKELENSPLYESDIASVLQIMDFDAFDDVVKTSPERLAMLVEKIKTSGLDDRGLRNQIKTIASGNIGTTKLGAEKSTQTIVTQLVNYAKATGDTFNAVWKPITLMRLGYPIRNVVEGGLRLPVAIAALSEELGYSKWAIAKNILPSPTENTKVAINNILEFKRTRTGKSKLRKQELDTISNINMTDNLIRQYTRGVNDSIREASKYIREIKSIRDTRLDDINNLFKIAITKFPKSKQDEYTRLMNKFVDDSITDAEQDKVIDLFVTKLQNEKDLSEFAGFFKFLNEALQNNLDEVAELLERGARGKAAAKARNIGKYPISPIEVDLLSRVRSIYEDMIFKNQALANLQLQRGFYLDEFDTLVNGATPSYKRVGEGVYEAFDGLFVNNAFAGTLGAFARKDISAIATARNVMGSNIRDSFIANFGRKANSVNVTPDMPEWAEQYARYFNAKLHNDELAVRIAKGESDADILTWLRDKESSQYRKNVAQAIKDWGGGSLPRFVQAVRVMTERNLPDLTDSGLDLRRILIQGNLTPQEALRIPPDLRVSVKGFELMPSADVTVSGAYQKFVNFFFKYIGSMPEDFFLRHPLYRSVYRNEIQSLGNLVQSQGKELTDNIIQSISRQAHFRANKTVVETLYTVNRLTEPAQFFRFASPFWMAQQNSSKFWLGETIKNPRIPYLGIMGWNSVNKSLEVRDVDEYNMRTAGALPVNTGEQVWITMPKGMAKFLGVEDLRELKFSKDSANLILQGAIPFIPSLGVPIQVPAGMLMKRLVGEKFDPNKELEKLGFVGKTIQEFLVGPQVRGPEGLIPTTAWMRNAYDWVNYEQSPRYWSRVELILEKKMLDINESGEAITTETASKIFKDATRQARNSLRAGVLFGLASPISVQPGSKWELFKSEYRLYVSQYGFEEGSIKFEEEYGPIVATYAKSSLSSNPAGLLSTNETLRNISEHKDLFNEIFSRNKAVAGALVNAGSVDQYSAVADQKLRDVKIDGQSLKGIKQNVVETEQDRQESLGWNRYIKAAEKIDAIYANESAAFRARAKEIARERIAEDYPIWFERYGQEINTNKTPVVQSIITVLNNDKFANSVQGQSDLWQGLRRWAVARQQLADEVKAQGRQQADEITLLRYAEAARRISLDHPEFRGFFERYISGDKLNKVQTRLK